MVPETLLRQINGLKRRERSLRLLWGTARCLAVVLVALMLVCLTDWFVDRWRETPWFLRLAMTSGWAIVMLVTAAVFIIRPLTRGPSDSLLALWIETKIPSLCNRFISAVQLNRKGAATDGMSAALIAVVTREVEAQTAGHDFAHVADHNRLRRAAALMAPFAVIAVVFLARWPEMTRALLTRQLLVDCEIPRSVRLESEIAELVWPAGEEVVLRFRATGAEFSEDTPGEVWTEPENRSAECYPLVWQKNTGPSEATFIARVQAAVGNFSYRARLKDGRTRHSSSVRFEPEPAIVAMTARVLLPAWCGLRPDGSPYERKQPHGDVTGLLGSITQVTVTVQKPIVRATLEILGTPHVRDSGVLTKAVPPGNSVLRRVDLKLDESASQAEGTFDLRVGESAYRVVVEDQYGFRNREPMQRVLRLAPDEPPHVALLSEQFPGEEKDGSAGDYDVDGVPVPLGGRVRIAYTCTSEYGLGRADKGRGPRLRYRVNDGQWWPLPLNEVAASENTGSFDLRSGAFEQSRPSDQVEFHAIPSADPMESPGRTEGGGRFDFQTRSIPNLRVGDHIEFFVEVFDQNPDPDRPPGRSQTRVKTVVTSTELEEWVRQTLREENRIRQLEDKQREVFGSAVVNADILTAQSTPRPATRLPQSKPLTTFLRGWQLLGPLPNPENRAHETTYAPELEQIDLSKEYDGLSGKVRWKAYISGKDLIDLATFFNHRDLGVAYGVCWVRMPKKKKVVLAVGSDDGIKVWINRRLVLAKWLNREAQPGEDVAKIVLEAGWNEVLVKVDNTEGLWGFYFELRKLNGGQPLTGLQVRTTPPEDDDGKRRVVGSPLRGNLQNCILLVQTQANTVTELGPDGKPLWALTGLSNPLDAEVLSGRRMLVTEQNKVTERDVQGKILWEKEIPTPVGAQRLQNGNTFIVCNNQLVEVDRAGKEVLKVNRGFNAARKLPNGQIAGYDGGRLVLLDQKGNVLKSNQLQAGGAGCNEILDNGHALISSPGNGNLIEFDLEGKVVNRFDIRGTSHGFRLPNGHTLLTVDGTKYLELDEKWQRVKETALATPTFRVKGR